MYSNANLPSDSFVLIVETDPLQRQVLIELVDNLDLACIEAENGQEAVDLIGEQMPTVIILNTIVPDAERVIADETRQAHPGLSTVPIVALSAYKDNATNWRGLRRMFPVGERLGQTKDDLRALIQGAISRPF